MDARRSCTLKYNISKATLKFYICGMIATKSYITELIKDSIKKKNPEAEIILFGSQARGESNYDSDLDILILLDYPKVSRLQEQEYRDVLYVIELEIGQPISTFIFAKNDWESTHKYTPLYNNIKKEGIYL